MIRIEDLNHLRLDKRIRFSEELVGGEVVTIVTYMIADADLWLETMAKECRGIVFDNIGKCICRTLEKFFNVGENSYTQLADAKEMELECLAKRDGSMLNPVLINGELFWKTKKSFYSDVAVFASKHVDDRVKDLSKYLIHKGLTPTYEFTSDENRIVIQYSGVPEFTLIAIRDTESGKYLNYEYMQAVSEQFGVKVIEKFDKTLEQCLSEVDTLTNFEGWCLRDIKTGFYCKLKTSWYLRNHKARTELRERDVADMVIDETLDDIKSALALDNFDLTDILKIEHQVVSELTDLRTAVEILVNGIEDKTNFKAIALTFKTHPMFGLIMSSVRGGEIDFKKFWVNYYRENYSLKCVYNKNF